jgi:hypothetical protein
MAEREGCDTFLVANAEASDFYKRHELKLAERWTKVQIKLGSMRQSKEIFEAVPLPDSVYDLVRGWALPIGRHQNAQHDWERTRPKAGPDFAEWRHLKLERVDLTVNRHRAYALFEEEPDHPAIANLFLFTPTHTPSLPEGSTPSRTEGSTLSTVEGRPELFSAVRQLGSQLGFTHLHCLVRSDFKLPNATPTDYHQQLLMKRLR